MNFIYKKIIIIQFLIFTFSGCGLLNKNLDINDMPIELPSYWQSPIYNEAELTGNWWKSFNDSKFEEFIILFKENSIDLQTLVYDRKIAYYSSAINKPGFFPSINSSARIDTNIQNLSGFGAAGNLLNNNEDSQETASSSTVNFGSTNFNLGIQFQWEIDVWGTLLHSRKSIEKDYESVIYNLNYLGFSLLVRASQLYYSVLESALQVEIAEKSYKRYVEIQDYVRSKYEKGLVNSLDLRLSQSSVSTAKISLENKKNVYRSLSRQIQILLGEYPSGYFLDSYDFPSKIPKINSGVPSDLLSRRPDIKALFAKAESAGFKFKEAERNRFPKLSLIGNIGTSSNNIEDMLNIDYGVWNLGTNILSPIFNNSKIKNNINLNFELKEKSKNELKKSLLQAFSEVENILYIDKSLVIQIDAINSALDESESIVQLTQDRYDKGLIGIESILQNQAIYNTLLSQQLSLLYKNIENRLSLILALGGEIILE
jgi:outer membrane protein, multidrug efflux system